jgi:hypothetical protein
MATPTVSGIHAGARDAKKVADYAMRDRPAHGSARICMHDQKISGPKR